MKRRLVTLLNPQRFLFLERNIQKRKINIVQLRFFQILIFSLLCNSLVAQNISHTFTANNTLIVPAGITNITVEGWGAGGAGGGASGFVTGRSGGGGGGGAYAKAIINVMVPQTLNVNVGGATAIGTGDGANGNPSYITGFETSFYAPGGRGGVGGNGNPPNGGQGGGLSTPLVVGDATSTAGLSGSAGSTFVAGVGLSSGAGGAAGNTAGGGGAGGAAIFSLALTTANGNGGLTYGGGGGGGISALGSVNGGAGAAGKMILSYTCKTFSFTSIKAANVCTTIGTTSLVELTGTPTTLPNGSYIVTYTRSLPSSGASLTATMTISDGSGKGTFTAVGFNTAGNSAITVTNIASQDCTSVITGPSNSVTIGVSTAPPSITLGAVASVCYSTSPQNTTLNYSAPTNSPTTYSITWNSIPTNSFVPVTNASLPASSISIAIPAGTAAGTYVGTITVKNAGECLSTSTNFNVIVNALPAVTLSNGAVCFNSAAQNATLNYSAAQNSPSTYSVTWSAGNSTNSFVAVTNATLTGSSITIPVPAGTLPATYTGTLVVKNANCSSAGNTFTITVNPVPTITTSGNLSVCQSTGTQMASLSYSATTNSPISYSIDWATLTDQGTTSFAFGSGSGTINNINVPANTSAATYPGTLTVTSANGCFSTHSISLVVQTRPIAPTASATQQPSCMDNTGVITVTSPAAGTGFAYSIDGSTFTNTTGVFTGLSAGGYNVSVRNTTSLCTSPSVPVTVNQLVVKSWNGSVSANWETPANWTPSGVPLASDCVDIPAMTISPIISGSNGSFYANKLTIENNGSLTVQGTNTLTVTNEVKVLGNGVFIFENNSSLVQVSDVVNTGNIKYRRNSTPIRRLDLTYWSSPVTRVPAFTMHDFSPNTLLDKYFKFDPMLSWITVLNGTEEMVKGNGYSIRAPQSYDTSIPQVYGGEFVGVPNNGTILGPPAVAGRSNLLGNPYPSAIYADQFIHDNQANYYGTLYFWTHNSLPSQSVPGDTSYYYSGTDFAIYNLSGITTVGSMSGTGATSPGNQNPPMGYIAAGQGFVAVSKTGQKAIYTNSMRVPGHNGQFFKSAIDELERHRVWLNMTNTQGAYKQLLVGYIEGATNFWDDNYDATSLDSNPYLDFYSINENKKLIIQGRSLPFLASDIVPLGYRSAIAGDFTIAIDHADGNLSSHAIYLQDKVTNTIHDLRNGGYTFTTAIGVFRERFVLRYASETLDTNSFTSLDKNVLVSVQNKNIRLQAISDTENLKETTIYDVGGKLLYHKEDIKNKELLITNLQPAYQVLLVKITLDNGYTVTKKIVF